MTDRVIAFLDVQNINRHARAAFFQGPTSYRLGQVNPVELGALIARRGPEDVERSLHEVRAYTGRPDPIKEPGANAAHLKQCAAWRARGVTVVTRSLQYLGWPGQPPREKGIDVQIAVDIVRMAIDREYDVAVLFSSDTDLAPALEFVTQHFGGRPRVETAAWKGRPGITNAGTTRIWCHFLGREDYDMVHDPRDYAK